MNKFLQLPAWFLASISLLMLALLSTYSWYHEKDFYKDLNDQIAKPQENLVKKVYINYVKIITIDGDEVTAKNRRGDVYRLYPARNIKQDEYYSFLGKVAPDGKVEIIQPYHQARWQLKHLLSLLSLFLVLYYIIKYIRFDQNSFLFYITGRKSDA
jgi:hypothetical protein